MTNTKLFSLGEYDLRFSGFFLDEDENIWAELNGDVYPLNFDDDDSQFTFYYSFFGKRLKQFTDKDTSVLGELFLDKLFSSEQWKEFIKPEENEEEDDSCSGFFVVVHSELEKDEDEEDDELTSERLIIDGTFSTIEDAFDYMDEISKEYPDVEFIVLSSLGSVKRNTTWSTHA